MFTKRKTGLKYLFALYSIIVFTLVFQCTTPYSTTVGTRWNLGSIYNPSSSQIHPTYKVYHNSDNTSLLLIKLFPSELLFNQANAAGEFVSKVSIQVQNYKVNFENKPELIDSGTYFYTLKQENVGKRFLAQIPIKTELGERYQVRVVTRDLLRHDFNLQFVDVDKTSENCSQNFNLTNQNNIPYFSSIITSASVCRIQQRFQNRENIYIDFYRKDSPFPKPTFAVNTEEFILQKPDSFFVLKYTPEMLLTLKDRGRYRFRFDTTQQNGLTISNFGDDFPKIESPVDLMEPLYYITTQGEYNNLQLQENKKMAVDNFWLGIGKNTSRARELIRIYYNRVYFANYYFTNISPGWKTDRGMVYIVYGSPDNIKKTPVSEIWIYNLIGNTSTIEFTFSYKTKNYTSDNYYLLRSESQDWHWREAVDAWRRGEIYLSD